MESKFLSGIYAITPNVAALTEGLGRQAALRKVSFKPWCAARQTMAATQALREILQTGVRPQDIERIEAFVLPPHLGMIDHGVKNDDRASHLTSVHYCMAVGALAEHMTADVGQSSPGVPPAVRDFMGKIKVAADESLLTDYPRSWPARVVVTAGGVRHERLVRHVPGDPARPFGRAHVHEKFARFVAPAMGAERTEQLLTLCSEALEGTGLGALVAEIDGVCGEALARS